MAAAWYVRRGEQQHGPITRADLDQMIAAGRVSGTDLVWTDGMTSWARVNSIAAVPRAEPPAADPFAAFLAESPQGVQVRRRPLRRQSRSAMPIVLAAMVGVALAAVLFVAYRGIGASLLGGGGPTTDFLNAYERAVKTYEAKAAGDGRFTLADINAINAEMAEMADKGERFMSAKAGGMSSSQRKRYMALTERFSKALMTLSQRMSFTP